MEIAAFFRFLLKHYRVLILIPVVTVTITYFLVKSLPDEYVAQGQISTGLIDKSNDINLSDAPAIQPSEIEQRFSNFIQQIQMSRIIILVSYRLIIHDLDSAHIAFRQPSKMLESISKLEKEKLVKHAKNKYLSQQQLINGVPEDEKLQQVLASMRYDVGSIKDKLGVSRVAQSDYISVSFESPHPLLSAFVVNTVCKEYIKLYTSIVTKTGERSVNYFSKLLVEKQNDLNVKMNRLKSYKIANNVINLPEQARIIYGEMVMVENKQAELNREIISVSGAIKAIDRKFNARDRKYFESALPRVNSEITDYKQKSLALINQWVDNDFDPIAKRQLDSLEILTGNKINEATDQAIFNPLSAKEDLIARKIGLQTQLDLAENSVQSLERLHNKLFAQFTRLVPFEASIQSYERDIDIASQEYLDILDRYNNTSLQTTFVPKLKLLQEATPGVLKPSKKMLLIILGGVISFLFCVIVLFVLFFLDDSIQSSKLLANSSGQPVIGELQLLANNKLNISDLWNDNGLNDLYKNFKDQLRALRLELNQELGSSKVLGIVSLAAREGKTFLALNLAYAYAVTDKRVLIIDGNFINPELTHALKGADMTYIEDFLATGDLNISKNSTSAISVLANKGGSKSLLELVNQSITEQRFNYLRETFDLILIEIPALNSSESSKEWILFTEKIIGAFQYAEYVANGRKGQINYLKTLNGKFIGWVLNKIPADPPKKEKKSV